MYLASPGFDSGDSTTSALTAFRPKPNSSGLKIEANLDFQD